MSRHKKRKSGVPDRWLDYTAVGKRLPGTRFIAFKVPLKQVLTRQLPVSQAFGPWELLDTVREEEEELGLIIDLTYTSRYYSPQDVPSSLQCVKIFTAGHEVPADDTILSFKRAVRRFLHDNADNDKLIGVHCTHGLNRTGYLVCRYLIDVDGVDPKAAVKLFNSSRGHNIERQNYLDDLQRGPRRSNDGMEESEQEPVRGSADCRPDNHSLIHSRFDHAPHRRSPVDSHLAPPLASPRHSFPSPIHPYRWPPPPPPPGAPWRRPPHLLPPEVVQWAPPPRPYRPCPPPPMPRYSPGWARQEDGGRRPERQRAGPHMRHQYRWGGDQRGREDDDHWT